MRTLLFASFADPAQAERALDTLLALGARLRDLTAVFHPERKVQPAIAARAVAGFGNVVGGGRLATAMIGVVEATTRGALAGSLAGYLEDQGVPGRIARNTAEALHSGNALLAIDCPSGKLGESEVSDLLRKFQADPCSRSQTPKKPVFTI